MIKIIAENQEQIITPTIFPDGTSQVWKIGIEKYANKAVKVIWNYEQEVELIWVNQILRLLHTSRIVVEELYIPYLPYGRQDKEVSDTSTFARTIFFESLSMCYANEVTTLDAHSFSYPIVSYEPTEQIISVISDYSPDCIVFPDAGAYTRYNHLFSGFNILVLDKDRDQLTGKINGLKVNEELTTLNISNYRVEKFLIIDDICDGAMSFIKSCEFIKNTYGGEVALYVTHGIFSKGTVCIYDAGINVIYTTDSLNEFRNNSKEIIERLIIV